MLIINQTFYDMKNDSFQHQLSKVEIFEIIYLLFVSISGALGNLLIIFSIIFAKAFNNLGNIFLINLAFSDLLVNLILFPIAVINVMRSDNVLPDIFCRLVAYIGCVSMSCSVYNLSWVALNRYWAVCRRNDYGKMFSKKRTIIYCLFVWITSLMLFIPSLFVLENPYDPDWMVCLWDTTVEIQYSFCLVVLVILLPFLLQCFCYWNISRVILDKRKWLEQSSGVNINLALKSRRIELNILKTMISALSCYLLLWIPFGVVVILEAFHVKLWLVAKKIMGWMAISNSSINFIIFGICNKTFRKHYNTFLKYYFCRCSCSNETHLNSNNSAT